MNFKFIILSLIFFSLFIKNIFCEDVSITGFVKNQNAEPVFNATVCLGNAQNLKAFTDSSGYFHLKNVSQINSSTPGNIKTNNFFIVNGKLHFTTKKINEPVKAKVYNTKGALITDAIYSRLLPGSHVVSLFKGKVAKGFYIVELQISQTKNVLKMIYSGKSAFSNIIGNEQVLLARTTGGKKAFAVIDSLYVTAYGFSREFIGITSYEQKDIEIVLNPVERKNNMIKIYSKGFKFSMGSHNGEYDEEPIHTVIFTYDFWMDTNEVSQEEYNTLMRTIYLGYTTPLWSDAIGLGNNLPVYYVNWYDAALYCNALSTNEGLDPVYTYSSFSGYPGNDCILNDLTIDLQKNGYRLSTEAEWEYACRGGVIGDYFWSDIPGANITNFVWHLYNSNGKLHEIGSKLPNTFGLYNMVGNISELCNDWYGSYTLDTQYDPKGPDSNNQNKRVLRGGYYQTEERVSRSSERTSLRQDETWQGTGFRVVLPIKD